MPKNGYQLGTRHMHYVPAPLALRPKTGHEHPQMCFLLLFPPRACVHCKSVVKFYSLPAQCVEDIAGGFA